MRPLQLILLACLVGLPLTCALGQDANIPIHSILLKQDASGWRMWVTHTVQKPVVNPYVLTLPPGVDALPDDWSVSPQAGWSYALETDEAKLATLDTLADYSDTIVRVSLGDKQVSGSLLLLSDKKIIVRELLPGVERLHTLDPKKVIAIDILQASRQSRSRVRFQAVPSVDTTQAVLQIAYSIPIAAPSFSYELAVDHNQAFLSGAIAISNSSGQNWDANTRVQIAYSGAQFPIEHALLASGETLTIPFITQSLDTHWRWTYSSQGLANRPELVASEPALLKGYPPGRVHIAFAEIPQIFFTTGIFSEKTAFALPAEDGIGFKSTAKATACESARAVDVIGVWLFAYDILAREIVVRANYTGGRPVRFVKSASPSDSVQLRLGDQLVADDMEFDMSDEITLQLEAYPSQLPKPVDFRSLSPQRILGLNLSLASGEAFERLSSMQRDVLQLQGWLAERTQFEEELRLQTLNQRLLGETLAIQTVGEVQQAMRELDQKIAARYAQFERAAVKRPTPPAGPTIGCAETTSDARLIVPPSMTVPGLESPETLEILPVPQTAENLPQPM